MHEVFHTALEFPQQLIVPLLPHDDLTENVLDVGVLAAVTGIGPHETRLVCDSSLDVIHCRG